MRNSFLGGSPSSDHVHGIAIGTNFVGSKIIEDCEFNYLNDSVVGTTNNRAVLVGNISLNTNPGGRSVDLKGTGKMAYAGNLWDVPPTALLPVANN